MLQLHGFVQQAHRRGQTAAHGPALLREVLVGGAGLEAETADLLVGLLQKGQRLAVQQVGVGIDWRAVSQGAGRSKCHQPYTQKAGA
ncbi:hypothetical protein D9M71_786830 [compost metagenome]